MLVLGIETATWMGGVALADDNKGIVAEVNINSPSSHSERLLPGIDRIFRETGTMLKDCDGICVSIGPGSFTGLRIGLATAKGLAFAAGKPMAGVSSLETLALGIPLARMPICPVIDARKGEVFACIFEWRGSELVSRTPEMVVSPEILMEKITEPTILVGNGLIPYGAFFRQGLKEKAVFLTPPFNFPRASVLAMRGMDRLSQGKGVGPEDLVPVYIRPSEAEINWRSSPRHR
ncbi:MAG: tRNA (adenosine(37)-N6)-threonylcarbamoyltransferase complex dimerization subunit type 1 TsaB [bacterium]